MEIPIYPEVQMTFFNDIDYEFRTRLRKKHMKKYYFQTFISKWTGVGNERPLLESLNSFHAEIYKFLILGKFSGEFIFDNGIQANVFDSSTQTEEERLKERYSLQSAAPIPYK